MKVLHNHHYGKPTILIHDRIINGCQDFTIEQLDEICSQYDVPADEKQQVLDAYTGKSTEEEINQYINDDDPSVRKAVAIYGNDKHRDQLVNDDYWGVRYAVAQYGNDKHRDQLLSDDHWRVRNAVAIYGTDQHREILMNDDYWLVRDAVAQYKNKK